ncbi:MAG: acyl transferase [Chitinophagaceae bacterium]|nr:acyl transferase [Chitinophagaceae bacterium]
MNNLLDYSNFQQELFDFNKFSFEDKALALFKLQYANNLVYKDFVDRMGYNPIEVNELTKIPFLPVGFFKSHSIIAEGYLPELVFESSGTTGMINSQHLVHDVSIYKQSFIEGFKQFYGNPEEWVIIGLLPAYLERQGSSLVYMVNDLIAFSKNTDSGFYLYEYEQLYQLLLQLESKQQKVLLIGVTFALLDFSEQFEMNLKHTVIMETGGMKGRRKEMTRVEVHEQLTCRLGLQSIHSEYGMTEMLSQGYSYGEGIFYPSKTMKVMIRSEDDPMEVQSMGTGIINVIDLSNVYSCAFIATEDVGRVYDDGRFEVRGRVDNSDIRGCSLLMV